MKSEELCASQNRLYALTVLLLATFLWFQLSLHSWLSRHPDLTPSPPYLLHEPAPCLAELPPSLLIFVTSAPEHGARRQAIRRTWANPASLSPLGAAVIFLLGRPSREQEQRSIAAEHARWGDLLQAPFPDSYTKLTLKTLSAMDWTVTRCPRAAFLLKTDDDVFVNVPSLHRDLQLKKNETFIRGCLKGHAATPLRQHPDGRLLPDHGFLGGHPPFVAGAGYVISVGLLPRLLDAARALPLFPIEDVFVTAKCARRAGVLPQHDPRFTCGERLRDDCAMARRFTGHWVSPQRQMDIWRKLTSGECAVS